MNLTEGATMTDERGKLFAAPWRERLPNGELGPEYGPVSVSAFARHLAKFRLWTWRPISTEARAADAERLCVFMRPEGGELRGDIPAGEIAVYVEIYEQGCSTRHVAREHKWHRSTVLGYLRRLKARSLDK